jgi:DNA-binding phage protein
MNPRFVACFFVPLLGLLSGCVGKRPFLLVQMCLGNEQNIALFMSAMKGIAQSQNMTFIDGSKENREALVQLKVSPNYRLIDIGIERKDGVGLMAGNLGLSRHEVAIGFSEGSNPAAAHKFADLTVGTLKQRWNVHAVPSGQGALPLKGCSSSTAKYEG